MTIKTPRFLDEFLAGTVRAAEIEDRIDNWHRGQLTGPDRYVDLHVYLGLTWEEYRLWVADGGLPQRSQHERERYDTIPVLIGDAMSMVRVHPPARCRPVCPVHWPSDHPLASAPRRWDAERGLVLRDCTHRLSHPDPDDRQVRLHSELAGHDCDGCCTAIVLAGESREDRRELEGEL